MGIQKAISNTLVFLLLIFSSCKTTDPAEEIPAYIKIDSIEFVVADPAHGSSSHKITDAWVYVDDQLTGAYELPVTLPVLSKGNRQIEIRAGIKVNGISATRAIYPYYESYEQFIELKPKEISVISPSVKYRSDLNFAWMADFETEIKIERLPGSHADIIRTTDPYVLGEYNGLACGAIFLDIDSSRFIGSSLTDFPLSLPRTAQPVFLEMNYKSNNNFSVGVIAINPSGDQAQVILHINPVEKWNKIYVNLTEAVNQNYEAKGYYFFIIADKSEEVQKSEIYIDNLKILY